MSLKDKLKNQQAQPATSTGTTEIAKKQPVTLAEQIAQMIPQIQRALPQHMSADRMARIVLTEIRKTPKLAECSRESFFGALLTSSQVGLEPGPLGHAFLIPYGSEVSFQFGYKGLLELVRRSGQVSHIYAYPVFMGDKFKYTLGLDPKIEYHEPGGESDPAKLTHVYAIARMNDGLTRFEVMSKAEVDKIKTRSPSVSRQKSSPWDTDYTEMARKTVLKRLCKTLPLSPEIMTAMSSDETIRHIDADPISVYDLDPAAKTDKPVEVAAQPEDTTPTPATTEGEQTPSLFEGKDGAPTA